MKLSVTDRAVLAGETGSTGERMALELVTKAAAMLGADRLIRIHSGHIDGCLFHGNAGVTYCEKLVSGGAQVRVPATTNVGALNLLRPDQCRLSSAARKMAFRLMVAHEKLGCRPSWTCAPYQAGARPEAGQQIAWGESNAVAFANTVLGARTNRYGDFLDIACAISGKAPFYGLHIAENRYARLVLDTSLLPAAVTQDSAFYPVLGSLIGRLAGETVCAVTGLPRDADEDKLKALCAAAASTGAVALVHLVGVTPEAPDLDTALGGNEPEATVTITAEMMADVRRNLSMVSDGPIDCVAVGSPHFSEAECRSVLALAGGRSFAVPFYICMGRHTLKALGADGTDLALVSLGVEIVTDTCVVVTPVLPAKPGVMMTNSAKFAHYAMGNTGHLPVFGTLAECVASAQQGHVRRPGQGDR
ncbi:aconitase X catalytic domain-containing protein [uncultured Roseobacter sp.]|uniref:aconitase X catalytic domain-containing protein n=1 Tax=uncultured Roseobacter sp. TaxID=114847 RepID=UPI00263741C1|nr:aconitase X catalytic domain-containing protein [uncultured Roseobacter sp.]